MKTTVTRIETKVKIAAEGERIDLPGRKPVTVEPYEAVVLQNMNSAVLSDSTHVTVRGSIIKKDGTPGLNSTEGTWSSEASRYAGYPHISTAPEWVQNLVAEVTR